MIRIKVRISNDGDATITDPVVGWQLGRKVLSRVEYETALVEGPAFIAAAETVAAAGDVEPGASTDVSVTINTAETGAIEDDSGVYPLEVGLRERRPAHAFA